MEKVIFLHNKSDDDFLEKGDSTEVVVTHSAPQEKKKSKIIIINGQVR